jgi:hypothetical protein
VAVVRERTEGEDPAEETVLRIVRHLVRLDEAMEREGFSVSARRRTVAEVLARVLEEAVNSGLMRIVMDEPDRNPDA